MLILRIENDDPSRLLPRLYVSADDPVSRGDVARMLRYLAARIETAQESGDTDNWLPIHLRDGSCDVTPASPPIPSKAQWVGEIVRVRASQGGTNLASEVKQAQAAYDAIYGGGK